MRLVEVADLEKFIRENVCTIGDDKAITRYKNGDFGDYDGVDYYIKKNEAIEIVKEMATK